MPVTHREGRQETKGRTDNQREIRERSSQPHRAGNSCFPSAWYLGWRWEAGEVYPACREGNPSKDAGQNV